LRSFADALAAALRSDPAVASVFYRVDLDWLLEHGLHLAPPAALAAAAGAARQERGLIAALGGVSGVADLTDVLAARLEAALARRDVALVLTEPALTNSGIIRPEPGFHKALRDLTVRRAPSSRSTKRTHWSRPTEGSRGSGVWSRTSSRWGSPSRPVSRLPRMA